MLVFPLSSSMPQQIQDTWRCPSLSLFGDSWKDMKGSFPVTKKQPLCLCLKHLVLSTDGGREKWVRARWINACCDCHISCWGVRSGQRVKAPLLTDSSFKAKRQNDRWSPQSHCSGEVDQVYWNLSGRVIGLLFLLFVWTNVWVFQGWKAIATGQDQVASETAEEWQRRSMRACVSAQRNSTKALICILNAGLSFLLAATLCYLSFSETLELITFTWREQLTDNIVKTFFVAGIPRLALRGIRHNCSVVAYTETDEHTKT